MIRRGKRCIGFVAVSSTAMLLVGGSAGAQERAPVVGPPEILAVEVALLVELGAFDEPLPTEVEAIHEAADLGDVLDVADRGTLVEALRRVDDRNAATVDRIGFGEPSDAVRRTAGPLTADDLDRLDRGVTLTSTAQEHVDALADLLHRQGQAPEDGARRGLGPQFGGFLARLPTAAVIDPSIPSARPAPASAPAPPQPPDTDDGLPRGVLALGLALIVALGAAVIGVVRRLSVANAQAHRDPLTGIGNRRSFDLALSRRIDDVVRSGGCLSVLMVDLDRFKHVNDTYGHVVGDEVLRLVAGTVAGAVRGGDTAFRFGGEEFCVLLPDTDADEATAVAERVRHAVESLTTEWNDQLHDGRFTVSIGVASGCGAGADDVVTRADGALYAAKTSGRNQVAVV